MCRRIIALALIVSCIFAMYPAVAVEDVDIITRSEFVDMEVPLAEGDSGAVGITIEDADEEISVDSGDAGDGFRSDEVFDAEGLPDDVVNGTDAGAYVPEEDGNITEEYHPGSIYIVLPEVYGASAASDSTTSIVVSTGQLAMIPGSSYDLKAVTEDGSSCEVLWSVQDANVADVDENGHVQAIACGETMITATSADGIAAQCRVIVRRVPDTVSFNCDVFYLGVGETSDALKVIIGDGGDGYFDGYTLASDKPKYVRVNADGTVTGMKAGTATVTVTTENNRTASIKITVKKAPSKVTASPKSLTLGIGETATLGYKLPSGTSGRVTYTSLNQEVVSVDRETGMVCAKAAGTAKIQIKTYNGKTCTTTVKVVKAPEKISISVPLQTMGVGQTQILKASVDAGSAARIIWESSDENIINVDEGKVTAVAVGVAEATASTYVDGVCASCQIEVKSAPEIVTLPESKIYIGVGETVQLEPDVGDSVGGFTYSSSKKSYATVSASGLIKGKKKGSSTITVKTYNGKKTTAKVVVGKAPSKVSASPVVMGLYERRKLEYKLSTGSYGTVTFTSLNPECVCVDAVTGEMYARNTGEASILIETYNDKRCTVKVNVVNAPTFVTITPDALNMRVGETAQLEAFVDDGADSKLKWESSDENVAVVSDGKVTATGTGNAKIVVRSHIDGVFGVCEVSVTPAPEKISVSHAKAYLGVGDTIQLKVSGGEPEGIYSFVSSKKSYATVDANGLIKGKKVGKSTITVKSADGQTAKVAVTVGSKPAKITANPTKTVLGLNEKAILGYKLPKGCYGSVTFTSRNPEYVSIDPLTGEMQAVGIGKAIIDLVTYNKKKTTATVEVVNAPEKVNMSVPALEIGVGQKMSVSASVNAGAESVISWESTDTDIATVANGSIKGLAPGTAEIIAKTYVDGVYGVCSVVVKPAPEKVTLPESKIYLGVGDTVKLEPDVGDSVGGYTYSSSNKKYAKVAVDGTVKGVKAGTAKITVKTYNGKKAVVTVIVRKAPSKVTPSVSYAELGLGDSFILGYTLPKGSNSTITFESMNKNVLNVDGATGEVTALALGEAKVRLRTHNGKESFCTVKVCPAPQWVKVEHTQAELGAGQTFRIKTQIPTDSRSSIRYTSLNDEVAVVSDEGIITGMSRGETDILVETCNPDVSAVVKAVVWDAPERVSLDIVGLEINVEESYKLNPTIPEGSKTDFTYTSSNAALATVSDDGIVTTRMQGEVFITVTAHNGKSASLRLNIFDPWYPESITLINGPDALFARGAAYQFEYTLVPETAKPMLKWTSSNEAVATVDQNGLVKPLSFGYTTICAVSEKNSDVEIRFTLAVQEKNRILAIPARTTQEDGIEENLKKIDAIRQSAIAEVDALRAANIIKTKDATKRKSMINNIFRDYAFPWKTTTLQKYWKKANSEGGVKDFKTDRVYYGMPYISGSGANRVYNAAKAVKEGRYTDSGKGYYLLNRKKLLESRYVGNDCSGLVNAAIWGTSSAHTYDRTVEIAESKAYKTIKSFKSMRPGDLICLGYRHVVMFLYYANPEKTRIMVIENGGPEPGTNTVHCSVYNVSYYTKQGYKVRRLASLG